jgi:hypothetical protein
LPCGQRQFQAEEWAKVRDDVVKQISYLESTLKQNGSGWLVGKSVSRQLCKSNFF